MASYIKMKPSNLDGWNDLKDKWTSCNRCPLCKERHKVCLFRGQLPCDVLFIGEAPGESEDIVGYPFVGPAGQLLDKLVEAAHREVAHESHLKGLRFGYTNILCCIPKRPDPVVGFHGVRSPSKGEAAACRPRLVDLYSMCAPQLIVTLGKVPTKMLPSELKNENKDVLELIHPSAILQMQGNGKQAYHHAELHMKRFVVRLRNALTLLNLPF